MIRQRFIFNIRKDAARKVKSTKPERPSGIWVHIDPNLLLDRIDYPPSLVAPVDFLDWGEGPWGIYGKEVPFVERGEMSEAHNLYQLWKTRHREGYKMIPCHATHQNGRLELILGLRATHRVNGWVWLKDPQSDVEKLLLNTSEVDSRLLEAEQYVSNINTWLNAELHTILVGASEPQEDGREVTSYRLMQGSSYFSSREEAEAMQELLRDVSSKATHAFVVTVPRETSSNPHVYFLWCILPACADWTPENFYKWLQDNWAEVKNFNRHLNLGDASFLHIYTTWPHPTTTRISNDD